MFCFHWEQSLLCSILSAKIICPAFDNGYEIQINLIKTIQK